MFPYNILFRIVAVIAFVGGVYWLGYHNGAAHQKTVYEAAQLKARDAVHAVENKGEAITADLHLNLEKQKVEYRWRTKVQLKEVPVYVTQYADAQCVVPVGFVSLYNQAVTSADPAIPVQPGGPLDAPSGLPLSTVLETDVYNIGVGHALRLEVLAWRAWYASQRDLYGTRGAHGPATTIAPAR